VVLGDRTLARGAAAPGEPVQLRVAPPERGWQALRLELEPDEFPADDARFAAVWIGPAPGVTVDPSAGPFANTAMTALMADGRAAAGQDVRVASADAASALPALLTPPADIVRLGAANRNLARLGVPWRYGAIESSPAIVHGARLDGISVASRYRLVRASATVGDTLATAAGEPWIVSGSGYVLLASRLDPASTTLPVRAVFVPWLADMVGLRLGAPAGDAGAPIQAAPGAPIRLPGGADAIEGAGGIRRGITGADTRAPDERGVWFVLNGARRVGAIEVNAPAAESQLARLPADVLAARLGTGRSRSAESAGAWVRESYAAGTRRPIITPLLIFALLLIAAEAIAVRTTRSLAA
jgi:hypothetical protein